MARLRLDLKYLNPLALAEVPEILECYENNDVKTLRGKINAKGYTLIPLMVYFEGSLHNTLYPIIKKAMTTRIVVGFKKLFISIKINNK